MAQHPISVKDKNFMKMISRNEENYKKFLERNITSESLYFVGVSLNLMFKKRVKLGEKFVRPNDPVYIIAEGGLSNWGRLDLAKLQVDAAMAAREQTQ